MSEHNPTGLDGFAFLEFSGPDADFLERHFAELGFTRVGTHKRKQIDLYKQGDIVFLLNHEPNSQAAEHAKQHGAGACAMGFRVHNSEKAFDYVVQKGATPFVGDFTDNEVNLPAINAIGGSVIYFVEKDTPLFEQDFDIHADTTHRDCGLCLIDHLTHNVHQNNMDTWANFYINLFNFKEIRFFDIEGEMTGLVSRAMGSPCGKIKIPLNESKDPNSQIEEFLKEYHGEGIQHIALSTENIYHSVSSLKEKGIKFLDVPDTYYEMIEERINWHQEPLDKLQALSILIDGEKTAEGGLLLQIFTENMFGPAFIEIIQRKGNDGFGEGNFQALFESIERDQIRRGVLVKEDIS